MWEHDAITRSVVSQLNDDDDDVVRHSASFHSCCDVIVQLDGFATNKQAGYDTGCCNLSK